MASVKYGDDNLKCFPCSREDTQKAAKHWCKNCREYICAECCMIHKKMKSLLTHELISLEDAKDEALLCQTIPNDIFCVLHKEEIATCFRLDDLQPYCFDCMLSIDTKLNKVVNIDDIVKRLDSTMIENDISNLNEISKVLEKSLYDVKISESEFSKSAEKISKSFQQTAKTTVKHIENLVKQMNSAFDVKVQKEHEQFSKQCKALEDFKIRLKTRKRLLETSKKLSSKEILALSLKAKHELQQESKHLEALLENSYSHNLIFQPSMIIEQIKDLGLLGEIIYEPTIPTALDEFKTIDEHIEKFQQGLFPGACAQVLVNNPTQIPTKDTEEASLQHTEKKTSVPGNKVNDHWGLMSPKNKKTVKLESTSNLFDGSFLPDGRLVVTDIKQRLLLFDKSFTLRENLTLHKDPRGLCISADGSSIYVMHRDGSLVTFKLKGILAKKLTQDSYVQLKLGATGVGITKEKIIAGYSDSIITYNMKGDKLSSVKKVGFDTYICVSKDNDKFFHRDSNAIVCRAVSDLSEIFRFANESLCDPRGITCDKHGNILVAGRWSDNIVIIKKDGSDGKVLLDLSHATKGLSALFYHPQCNIFVVLSCSTDKNYINALEVYDL